MAENGLLAAALAYEARGWSVIPIRPSIKKPLLLEWKPFQKKRLTPGELRGFWRETPDANVGTVTGEVSGISVVDVDGPKGVAALKAAGITLPQTLTFRTPHGWHYVYAYDKRFHQGGGLLEAVDIRNDGGYFVVPPSVVWPCTKPGCAIPPDKHGRDYTIGRDAPVVSFGEVPRELQEIRTKRDAAFREPEQPAWIAEALLKGAPEGQRNDMAARIAGYFRSIGMGQDIALVALKQFADACTPPMGYEELKAVLVSVWRYQPTKLVSFTGQTTPAPLVEETVSTRRLFRWPDSGVLIRAERIREHSDSSITCWLTVSTPTLGEMYGPVSFNLLAERSRSGLVKSLDSREKLNWESYLDQIAKHVVASLTRTSQSEDAADMAPPTNAPWLAFPFLRAEEACLLYADGGSGKSSWATALAISLACGESILPGIRVAGRVPVMYLDWEGNAGQFATLVRALERASGVSVPKGALRYRRMRQSLPDELDSVIRDQSEWGTQVSVVDSIVGAAGEDVEKAEAARLHFNCLAQMKTASINLTHITKAGDTAKPYGSVFYWNYARACWFGQRDSDESMFAIYHKKASYSRFFSPLSWLADIENDPNDCMLSLRYRSSDIHESESLSAHTSILDRALHYLATNPPLPTNSLAEALDVKPNSLLQAMLRGRKQGKVRQLVPGMEWQPVRSDNINAVTSLSPISVTPVMTGSPLEKGGALSHQHNGRHVTSSNGTVTLADASDDLVYNEQGQLIDAASGKEVLE